jgi:hypothetical protein
MNVRELMRESFLLGVDVAHAHDASLVKTMKRTRSPWAASAPRDGAVSAWRDHTAYAAGAVVTHRSVRYRALCGNFGFEPNGPSGSRGPSWMRVGDTPSSRRVVKSVRVAAGEDIARYVSRPPVPLAREDLPTFTAADAAKQVPEWTEKLRQLEAELRRCIDPARLQALVREVQAVERHLAKLRALADRED